MTQFCLTVWGDYACFTRPEMKVERFSYDVITPSAARAVFEAIFWKPSFRWEIKTVEVLNPIRWANIRRNEVESIASYGTIRTAMQVGKGELGIFIEEDRQQRAATILRNVKYRIHASQVMIKREGGGDNPQKLLEMFKRRAEKGQCFMQPYLGCREFSAYFELGSDNTPALAEDADLGWMLHDMDFTQDPPQPKFFRAQMRQGIIKIPSLDIREVRV